MHKGGKKGGGSGLGFGSGGSGYGAGGGAASTSVTSYIGGNGANGWCGVYW